MILRDGNNDAAFQLCGLYCFPNVSRLAFHGFLCSAGEKGALRQVWVEAQVESLSSQGKDSILSLNAAGKDY